MLSAEELHRRGLAHSNAGRYTSARQRFRQALERADSPDTLARVKLSLGYVEAELGSTADGLALCDEALAVPGLSRQVRGLVESQIGLLQMRAGEGQRALASFATAIALLDESPEARARAHLNRGRVHLQRGQPELAIEDTRLAADLFREAGNEIEAAKADHNVGYAQLLAGDLVGALRRMEAAAPLLEHLSATYRAVVAQDRAEVLVAAGMPADAQAAFEEAARAYGSRRLRQRQAEVELILARSIAWDDPRRGAAVARRAERRFRQQGSDAWALRAEAVKLAAEIDAATAPASHVRRAGELAATLRSLGFRHESLLMSVSVARAWLGAGDPEAAARRLRSVRPTLMTPVGIRMLAREVRADVASAKGHRTAALSHVRRGLGELLDWQSSFGSLDLQSSLVGHGRRLAFTGLRLALTDGRPGVVFEWSERARTLASQVAAVRPPADPAAARALTELRQAGGDETVAAPLRERIRQRAWYGEGSGEVAEPTSLDLLAAELGATGAALVSYLVVDETVHCLVASADRCEVVALGSARPVRSLLSGMQADLDMAATDLPSALRRAVVDGLRDRLRGLDERLVTPILGRLGDIPRVVVVPPAPLAGTPWAMLPALRDRALTVPRSATLWLRGRAARPLRAERVGLVAGPAVARADEEVARVAKRWVASCAGSPPEVLTGEAARATDVSALAERVDVLHVAAHGRHSADNPLFSGLELADGPWFGYDIDQLSAIPGTVVLSACELGRSSVRWGLETVGMTVAWQHAGSRCVIAAPASVGDDLACEVLAATHTRLAAGATPAEALLGAVRGLGDAGGLSSFVCHGAAW